ncbi:MAG: PH domain-containing protein [Actinomycetota bacterium]
MMDAVVPATPPPDDPTGTPFTNRAIPIEALPRLDDDAFDSVDPRYLRGWLIVFGVGVVATVLTGVIVAALVEVPAVPLVIAAGVIALLAVTSAYTVVETRRLGYQLREHDVSLRSGVINHRVATIPFARVQHVTVSRSAFERMLGLATVQVNSAGPDIAIPGLDADHADRIKQLVTERAGIDDERTGAAGPGDDPFASPPRPNSAGTGTESLESPQIGR